MKEKNRPLELSEAAFEEAARQVVGLCARYLAGIDGRPVFPETTGALTLDLFDRPCPETGLGPAALEELSAVVDHSRALNGRALGYVLGTAEPIAALGDLLASVLNQNLTAWRSSPAATVIERTVPRWLARAIGCEGFSGTLVGGGSAANLFGLALARERALPANDRGATPGVVYASDQVHLSIPRAMALLGLGREQLHLLPSDRSHRLDPSAVDQAIRADLAAGRKPLAIVANAGTVATGAIDPLEALADLAQAHGLWLHADGAYGALAAMARPALFAGLSRCDSLSLDAHKWLYQPLDCGCVLYRDEALARRTFFQPADYAEVLSEDPIESLAFFDTSPELSRRFRGLKVWLSLRYHGLDAFRRAIESNLQLAAQLRTRIEAHPRLEARGPAPLSAVCFRYLPAAGHEGPEVDALNRTLLAQLNRRGRVFLSNATVEETFCLRACITNHRTTETDVQVVIEEVLAVGAKLEGSRP